MELLYFIDRTLTDRIQKATFWVGMRVGFRISGLVRIFWFLMVPLSYLIVTYFNDISWKDLIVISTVFSITMFVVYLLGTFVAVILLLTHLRLDRKMALEINKEFSSGYEAWGITFVCICLILIFHFIDKQIVAYTSLFVALHESSEAIRAFEERTRGKTQNRNRKMASEVLDKLLERCKSWLPRPQPKPVPITVR